MSVARVRRISGPVLHARVDGAFVLREAVRVGERGLLGEVVRIEGQEIVVQVYEDTTGLRPGVQVTGTGLPLSVRLGPGLLGRIFDGLLRPLAGTSSAYVEPGSLGSASLACPFTPLVELGQQIGPGATLGRVSPEQGRAQVCLVPPRLGLRAEADWTAEVTRIAQPGVYPDDLPLCTVRDAAGETHEMAMSHLWPVREPRPIAERLPGDEPLLTGQRVIDCVFPVARGGKAAIPGGFGTGKTVLLESLAKWCNADIIVYVGCGERGNEMAGLLDEFPRLEDPRTGRPLMERTVIIANTSNMPVAAREASIYTGVTVAEYFRDQGLHVALMADSTSRWAEALREVSGRLGELPGEGGYPAYLSSRLADFYERAARVTTLGGQPGSVTLIGSVSPPSGDFSEPVVTHTKRYIKTFWALDVTRAQARFYPAIHPLLSYSEDAPQLAHWWQTQGNPEWPELRRRFLVLLEEQAHLERMARIIGKDAMPVRQQLILLCAELVNEALLRQSSFSAVDRYASPTRQTAIMRLLGRFIELAEQAIAAGHSPEEIGRLDVFRRLQRVGEEIPEEQWERFKELGVALEQAFVPLLGMEGRAAAREATAYAR